MSTKILIVGLDGATWDTLHPLIQQGVMPNLAQLVKGGTQGSLLSTIPPETAPAWTAFLTGTNPGKNGVFDFVNVNRTGQRISLVNSRSIRTCSLLDILGQMGKKTISINVPMTYPPENVNGILIGGILSPKVGPQCIYPQTFYSQIKKHFPDYAIVDRRKLYHSSLESFIQRHIEVERVRFELSTYLMKNQEWELFMVHNQSMDAVQHACWHYMCSQGKTWSTVQKFYEASDQLLGKLVKTAGEETTVIVLSDHGFGSLNKGIQLNYWLKKNGFLHVKRGIKSKLMALEEFVKMYPSLNHMADFLLNKLTKYTPVKEQFLRSRLIQDMVDWEKTSAFLIGGWPYGNVYINVKREREKKKLSEKLIRDLTALKDPEDGKTSMITRVYRREDIYQGPSLREAPDLVLQPAEGYGFFSSLSNRNLLRQGVENDISGTHRPHGVFIIKGPPVRSDKKILQANIVDLLPTILALMNIDVPQDCDGRVLSKIFINNPTVSKRKYETVRGKSFSSDEEKVKQRLKELGYF